MICIHEKKKLLILFTSICASLSTILLVMSVATEHWLVGKELYKGTLEELYFLPSNYTGAVYITTNFGLWRSCQEYIDKDEAVLRPSLCRNIPYKEGETLIGQKEDDTIMGSIIRSCRKTMIFPMLSIFLEISGDITCLLGYCLGGRRRYLVFITGVLFVASGMSLLVGSILFMGAVTGDANHQPVVAKDEIPVFRYAYGSSFIMLVMAFCFDEISGVLSVYLFIIRHKESVRRKHAKLRAFKSKADQIQNYFKRKTRNHSQSSNGDASRRSSFMPITQEHPTMYHMNRDTSHITMMTSIESHNHINSFLNEETAAKRTPEIKVNDACVIDNNTKDELTPLVPLSILPPPEFQTPAGQEIQQSGKRMVRCKTTPV